MESRRNKAGRSLRQREITNIQTSKQDDRTSPSTQMHREFEDSRTPTTAGNIKENVNTLYNGRNTAGKQPEHYQPSSDQLENQAPDTTPKSSPKPEMQEKYTNVSDQGP